MSKRSKDTPIVDGPPPEPQYTPREPFGPPFYAEDVPQFDNMHWHLNLRAYEAWLISPERKELLKHPRPRDINYWYCAYEGCDASISKNILIFPEGEVWAMTKFGEKAFCPKHHPSWVSSWQQKKEVLRNRRGRG